MNLPSCPQEAAVTEAVRAGSLDGCLASHVATCAICGEIFQAMRWMQVLARDSEGNANLPSASLLWWRAQLSDKGSKTDRAQHSIELLETAFAAFICVCAAGWLAWKWPAIHGFLVGTMATAERSLTLYSISNASLLAVGLSCLVAVVASYLLFTDE